MSALGTELSVRRAWRTRWQPRRELVREHDEPSRELLVRGVGAGNDDGRRVRRLGRGEEHPTVHGDSAGEWRARHRTQSYKAARRARPGSTLGTCCRGRAPAMTGRLCRRFARLCARWWPRGTARSAPVPDASAATRRARPSATLGTCCRGRAHAMTGRLCRRCVCLCARWWPRRTARSATARKSCQAVRRARPSATLSTCCRGRAPVMTGWWPRRRRQLVPAVCCCRGNTCNDGTCRRW